MAFYLDNLRTEAEETFIADKESLSFIPNKIGCYILYDQDYKVIYIGRSGSVKSRVTTHFGNMKNKINVAEVFILNDYKKAEVYEKSLIFELQPSMNVVRPSVNKETIDAKDFFFIEEKYLELYKNKSIVKITEELVLDGLIATYTPKAFAVLSCLVLAIDSDGICKPTLKWVEEKTGLTRATSLRALRDLETIPFKGKPIIDIYRHPNGMTKLYKFNF